MESFFQKHPMPLTERDAIELIHAKVHCIKGMFDGDSDKELALKELASIPEMIEDFFDAKKLDISLYQTA